MKEKHISRFSRRQFLTSSVLSAGALASVPVNVKAEAGVRERIHSRHHSVPMPDSGVYKVKFSEPIESAVPANLDGDGLTDWVAKPIFAKKTDIFRLEARNHAGKLLWKFNSGLDGHRMTHAQHVPLTVWDFDGDGIDEVVTLKLGTTNNPPVRAQIVMLNGKTGEEKTMTPVPWPGGGGNSRYNHGTTRSYGTVAFLDGPDRPPSYVFHLGTYIDGCCWAFDIVDGKFRQRWAYQHAFHIGTGHHGLIAFDIDEDGRDEILMGGTILDADGCRTFSWSDKEAIGHTDFVIPGKLDPDKPGYQLLFGFEFGYGLALTSAEGEVYWRNKDFYHAHSGWVARIREDLPGEQIRCVSKILPKTWVFDGYPPEVTHDQERTKSWNGLLDIKGNLIETGDFDNTTRPPQWSGGEVYDSWDKVAEELGIKLKDLGQFTACDVGGGPMHGAEEIIAFKGDTLAVYFNRKAKPYPSRWSNLNYRKMAISSLGSGYRRKDTYRTLDYPKQIHLPTAYIRVEDERNIGVRERVKTPGVRAIKGQKFILFRDAVHQFQGSGSWDSNGRKISSYEWDFGDGSKSSEADPLKRFEKNGTYTVTLTIRSGRRMSTEEVEVEIQDVVLDYISHVPHKLSIREFSEGSSLYIDNGAVAQNVPEELKGMSLICTHHEIEHLRGGMLFSWDVTQIPFESIVFRTPIEMDVHVAMDEYASDKPAPDLYAKYNHKSPHTHEVKFWPEWLLNDGWKRTGLSVRNSMNGRQHVIYKKSFRPGDMVRIGPNRYQKSMMGDWDRNMYFVLLSEQPRLWMDKLFE